MKKLMRYIDGNALAVLAAAILFMMLSMIGGCGNVQMIDTVFSFNTALVKWPDGTMKEIKIRKWRDYEGEQLQITAEDGTVYLVSSFNTVLVRKAR